MQGVPATIKSLSRRRHNAVFSLALPKQSFSSRPNVQPRYFPALRSAVPNSSPRIHINRCSVRFVTENDPLCFEQQCPHTVAPSLYTAPFIVAADRATTDVASDFCILLSPTSNNTTIIRAAYATTNDGISELASLKKP